MIRLSTLPCALVLSCLLAAAAPSQDAMAGSGFIGRPVTLDLRDVPLADVLRFFHEQFGLNFVIDQGVPETRVTVTLREIPWNFALHAILRANGLGAIQEGPATWVIAPHPTLETPSFGGPRASGKRISLEYRNADLREVVRDIRERAGVDLALSDDVPRGLKVTINAREVPWEQALGWILWSHRLRAFERGDTVIIEPLR